MGARPDQQLTLNFLSVVHKLWQQYPGWYAVQESADDLVASLAQMSIKALAADLRDGLSGSVTGEEVEGWLESGDGRKPLTLREVLNKIIHGSPTRVEVREGVVWLHFSNNTPTIGPPWREAVVSATDVLRCLENNLYKHRGSPAEVREQEIRALLVSLGTEKFLPSRLQAAEVERGT